LTRLEHRDGAKPQPLLRGGFRKQTEPKRRVDEQTPDTPLHIANNYTRHITHAAAVDNRLQY